MKLLRAFVIPLVLVLAGCSNSPKSILVAEINRVCTTDNSACLILSQQKDSGVYHFSVHAEIITPEITGGGGILDFLSDEIIAVKMAWINDSIAKIEIPNNITVLQQQNQLFFNGRTLYFRYYNAGNAAESAPQDPHLVPKKVFVGEWQTYESLPPLQLIEASKAAYSRALSPEHITAFKPNIKDTTMFLPTATGNPSFEIYRQTDQGWRGNQFVGYYGSTKFYALENWVSSNEGLSFGTMFLLDSITGHSYSFSSIGDGPVEAPIFSPQSSFLAYFYNMEYEQNECFVGIVHLDRHNRNQGDNFMQEIGSFSTDKFAVEGLKWKYDSTLILEVFEREGFDASKQFSYYKIEVSNRNK